MGPPLPPLQFLDYPRREWEGRCRVQVFHRWSDKSDNPGVRLSQWHPGRGPPHACFSGKFPRLLPLMVINRHQCINWYWSNSFWGISFGHSYKKRKIKRRKACIILGEKCVHYWRFPYWLFVKNPCGSFISLNFYSGIFIDHKKLQRQHRSFLCNLPLVTPLVTSCIIIVCY